MAELNFPLSFKRQYSGSLDVDLVFETLVARDTYLTDPLRYAGMIVSCLELEGKIFVLNNAMDAWLSASGTSSLKVKTSSTDTTEGYLADKILGTTSKILVTKENAGANETLKVNIGTDVFDKVVDDTDDIKESTTKVFVTPAEKIAITHTNRTALNAITGTNTGDETKETILSKLTFTPENVANKDIDGTLTANSDIKYPSQKAVKTYVDTKQDKFYMQSTTPTTPKKNDVWVDTTASPYLIKIYDDVTSTWIPAGSGGAKAEDIAYINGDIKTVKEALDKLLYSNLAISLTSTSNSVQEKGITLNSIVLNWTYSKNVVSQTLDGVTLDVLDRTYTEGTSISTNKTYTLSANDGTKATAKSISFSFINGIYYGVSSSTTYDSSLILSLTKKLQTNNTIEITVDCLSDNYIYYASPLAYGNPTFEVGGFTGGFTLADTFTFTNVNGYSESYQLWQSDSTSLGDTTVTIS